MYIDIYILYITSSEFFFISSDIYIREQEKEIHFKELLHEVVEAGKSKIFKVGQEVQT